MPFPGTLPVALGGAGPQLGYVHPGSAKFDGSANYMEWPEAAAHAGSGINDNTISTTSFWMRLGVISNVDRVIFTGALDGNNGALCLLQSGHQLQFYQIAGGAVQFLLRTERVFRDTTAWYHIHYQYDSNNATPDLRQRIWVNGDEETVYASRTNPSLALGAVWVTNGYQTQVGTYTPTAQAFSGFLADLHHFDGLLIDPSVFGRFDPVHGEWIPKLVTGVTYPGRSFHLDYADENDLGNDVSGNNNDFKLTNMGSSDSMIDVPANTFPIWNTVGYNSSMEFATAALDAFRSGAAVAPHIEATHLVPKTGKWYYEVNVQTAASGNPDIGFKWAAERSSQRDNAGIGATGSNAANGAVYRSDGSLFAEGTQTVSWGATFTASDVIGVAFDADTGEIWFAKNNVWQGSGSPDPATGTDPAHTISTFKQHPYPAIPDVVPAIGNFGGSAARANFGQIRPGLTHAPPAGFKAISTGNFPTPTGPALFPDRFFDIIQYEGDGASSRTLTGLKFQPDMVLLKNIDSGVDGWRVVMNMAGFSPSPSTPNNMDTTNTNAPADIVNGNIESLNNDGFDVADGATNGNAVNASGQTHQAWCWKSDPAAGFEIIRYTGDGVAGRTVPHNLGRPLEFLLVKRLDAVSSWNYYTSNYGDITDPETDYLRWNSQGPAVDNNTFWNDTAPTDSVFSLGTSPEVNALDGEYVALAFASVPGFMKVYSMEGNSNVNGAFMQLDFAPRFFHAKNKNNGLSTAQVFTDPILGGENNEQENLMDLAVPLSLAAGIPKDLLANGIKHRTSNQTTNENGSHHVGFAYSQVYYKFPRGQ